MRRDSLTHSIRGMVPLSEILQAVLQGFINQSREAGQEPPDFVTERFDRQSPTDKPPPDPPR